MAKNIFNAVKMTRPNKNVFDLTHDLKFSANMGELVPIMVTEAVPGDKFKIGCESLIRFAPLVSPVMHRMDVSVHYFFVPNRIVWPNWENFITNTKVNDVLPAFPTRSVNSLNHTPLMDYMGIPKPEIGAVTEVINAIPLAAYQKIYNEYYRDQNLQTVTGDLLADGSNNTLANLTLMRKRAWEHDYFTSALPFAQKGDSVEIPLGEVQLRSDWATDGVGGRFERLGGGQAQGDLQAIPGIGDAGNISDGTETNLAYDPNGTLETAPTTINDLRRAFRLQEWLEKNARGGTRYIENILAHFGVKSSDKRLQRPEYITGIKSPVTISEVLNTTGTAELPQGNMAGHGIGVVSGKYGSYYCEEHGYIIGIMSVMPKTAYQQGIPKHFLKHTDPFQYYWPSFAHIGEQEVLKKEIYAFTATGGETFGYVPRYAEYKFEQNRVAGEFRSTLNHWHLGRIFDTEPALNSAFVTSNPTHRAFAVTDETEDKLYCHVLNKVTAIRPMPKFGTPQF